MEPNFSIIAGLIGDPARARMLSALMAGKALTTTELALEADITAQTASSHLAKLVDAQLLAVRKQGRHRYFQLHRPDVAELIEKLLNVTVTSTIQTGPVDSKLRHARVCYDHLAGALGVALYDSLVSKSFLIDNGEEAIIT
ncbi:ArsR/SmtB family transcription factor [Reinekea thalattae]|uniref:ArsR/SmtB family transcription factor n=1 Tax=Reinekea thalattae TaxID=2593301 RepID=UPI001FE6BCE6|nr:winged helix-turn-helix domain-containing protein [Reinekea thalattae]